MTPIAPALLAAAAAAGELRASVLDASGRGVPEAVVYVEKAPGGPFPAPAAQTTIDQIDTEFSPRVLAVLAGTSVRFPNKDQIQHHIYSFSKAKRFERPLYKGNDAPPVLFDQSGVVKIGCNIHDWMRAYVVVLDNPYFATTGADGRATISGLPPGEYAVLAWSERLRGAVEATRQRVVVAGEPVALAFRPALTPPRKTAKGPRGPY